MGADHIVLGPQGELGPIDPILAIQRVLPQPGGGQGILQENVSVEDVMAYLRFVKERAGLSDQEALSLSLGKLTDRMDAVALGNLYRTHSHIRDVARRMLLSRREPASEQEMATIVETLAERVYAHGHAIGLRDAKEIGLPVESATEDEDRVMWALLTEYERDLNLLEPIDPAVAAANHDVFREDAVIAVIESTRAVHEFAGHIEIRAQRQMPPNLNVALNLDLQLPAGLNPQELPAALQALLQLAQQDLLQHAQQAVQQALKAQAPIVGLEAGFRNGSWRRSS